MVRGTMAQTESLATDDLMTIGQMCETFGVTPRTLRFYEAKELVAPLRTGTRRLFTRRCRARLKLILQGKRFGFSLEDIRQLLDLYDLGDSQATQIMRTRALALERLAAMEAQRAELDAAIADLKDQLARTDTLLAQREAE
ncbi:MerR family DNA-binding transcriptional regulator [Amaricoccus sp.]|uniref:MerR family transcriptional regulator n=1 Tax=Amaricoccus sp. TaxID=1872485 RepID=UPI002610029B|nr:MerR family DNA-binding transcriptional regulator [Amaricoccus sp.]HRO10524.1 MerR family DNA-binding transcriptional regulator [Amaricoccus sp.]